MGRHAASGPPSGPRRDTAGPAVPAAPAVRTDPTLPSVPAVPTVPSAPADPPAGPPSADAQPAPAGVRTQRLTLAGAAAVATGAVTAWAGTPWPTALAASAAAAAVVLLAAWVASTVPGPRTTPDGSETAQRTAPGEPVQ